jgi:hypothetical protein
MRRSHCLFFALHAACSVAVSCTSASEPNVAFGSSRAVGDWQPTKTGVEADASVHTLVDEALSGNVVPKTGNAAGHSADISPQPAGAGVGGADAPEADGGTTQSTGTGGSASATGPTPSVTSLSFQVTTSAAGGRYQPKNIGAIWVEDASGHVVKSLKVWAATRRRYLTGYLGAMAGSSIDVTASATLSRHQTHSVTWNLKDRNGAVVSAGAYRVKMELTDADKTGKSNTVDFDTSMGAVSLSPSDAPSFGAMKLELK